MPDKRDKMIKLYVSREELEIIEDNMTRDGARNRASWMRQLAMQGGGVNTKIAEVAGALALLINANAHSNLTPAEHDALCGRLEQLHQTLQARL